MTATKAADFWQTVLAHADQLRLLSQLTPDEPGWQHAIKGVRQAGEVLADAVAAFDERLGIEIDNTPTQDGSAIRLAVTCNGDPDGVDAVLALTAAAPALPDGLIVHAFKPPVPKEVMADFGVIEFADTEVRFQDVRYVAAPSEDSPGRYDIVCFLAPEAAIDVDENIPGITVAAVVLGMGLGELKVMKLVARLGVLLTNEPPANSVSAWELADRLYSTSH
ncbi:hypothetical protein [Azohydromonas australica]|uniref:hypothetical protein n=1 Tax=Azohydromonas australica TaxID=364039 RepID=UPI00042A4751|nr:hypothetical protein [Azohydromonas australica]